MVVDGDNTLDGKTGLIQDLVPGFQDWKYSGTMTQTWHQVQMTQIYSNPLNFFASSCPENPCRCLFPRLLHAFFSKVKFYSKKITFPGLPGQGRWREDKHLSYKDLLTITFTQVSHWDDRGMKAFRYSCGSRCRRECRWKTPMCRQRSDCADEDTRSDCVDEDTHPSWVCRMLERVDYQEWSSSKHFSKMKAQYEMFVDTVGSRQVTV